MPGVKQIAELAESNAAAQDLFNDFGTQMGLFLQPWIEKFGIETFVMGGNISRAYNLFGSSLNDFLSKADLNMTVAVSELKETASFIGAATLVDDNFYEKVLPALRKM